VNTTESAVRIVHEPSGISVRVSASRSQIANKALAMTLLENKIRAAIAAEELSALRCAANISPHVAELDSVDS
jgi:protein subunit release factor A